MNKLVGASVSQAQARPKPPRACGLEIGRLDLQHKSIVLRAIMVSSARPPSIQTGARLACVYTRLGLKAR